jgi:hypothetical protein
VIQSDKDIRKVNEKAKQLQSADLYLRWPSNIDNMTSGR